jgi:hypothetical protein
LLVEQGANVMLDDDLLTRVPELHTAGAMPEGDRQSAGRAAGHGHVAGAGHRPDAQRSCRSLRCRLLGELRLEHGQGAGYDYPLEG